ncbi:unnamed protein product [Caenorhabditis sp. 36 PRJEB53466]|nr:unnamed protein product [Caenorhabditis sp. 36 PRJEB53466]
MDEEKIVLIGNETDLLHSGYNFAIRDHGRKYPSAIHFTHYSIIHSLHISDTFAEELLCTNSSDVAQKAQVILQEHMPEGHDMNSLGGYLQTSLNSYSLQGLRLRSEQDKDFEKTLLKTNEALLIVCDEKNSHLGIGMDDKTFMEWMAKEKADSRQIAYWMRNEHTKPVDLGKNQLGNWLMYLRYEIREKRKASVLSRPIVQVEGLSTDKDDKPVMISINDLVISLEGIFRPLSNYYAFPFEMKGERYRSVEHYAFEKLFNSLKLDDKAIEKIQTTPVPLNVPIVAQKVLRALKVKPEAIAEKTPKMDRWRQSAMKHKIYHNEYLQQLLLSTGSAIIIDSALGDPLWTCGGTEMELQWLLTKPYVTPEKLISWMLGKESGNKKTPKSVSHLFGNKSGLLLMELRQKLSVNTQSRIPLISPINTTSLSAMVTANVICFTPESVFHPLYPAEIRIGADGRCLQSPAHYVALQAVKFLNMNKEDNEYIMDNVNSVECWTRLHEVIEQRGRGLEMEQTWWMEKRIQFVKEGLQLMLEQHPALLRALLDTGDALLVYCARFSSIDTELSIGMREMDLRYWLSEVDVTTKQLIDLCTRPMAFRPPYLGGNRLGLLLMEIRREFVLQGIFPAQLPELQLTVECVLGSDSPTENFVTSQYFDILDPWNYGALWINPLFLIAKDGHQEAMAACTRIKCPQRYVTVDDEKVTGIVDELVKEQTQEEALAQIAPEDLRAVFMKLCARLKSKVECLEHQSAEMAMQAWESHRLQSIRRSLADTKERTEADSSSGPSISAPPFPLRHGRMAAGREREREEERERRNAPPTSSTSSASVSATPSARKERTEYKIPTNTKRKFGKDRGEKKTETGATTENAAKTSSLLGKRERIQETKKRGHSSPSRKSLSSTTAANSGTPVKKAAVPPPAPPKPKRDPDEELSEGEILSTDEEDNS